MANKINLNPLAEELNAILSQSLAGQFLSDLGTRLYFPKGIIAQSGEAKKHSKIANATIGMAVKNGKPLILNALKDQLPGFESQEIVAYSPTAGIEELRKEWRDAIIRKNPSLKGVSMSLPVLVPGLTAGLSYLSDLFLGEDSVLLTGNPAWDNYVLIVEARRNSRLKGFSLFKDNGFDIAGFEATVKEEAKSGTVRMLLNFPQNPSGYTPTKRETAEIVRVLMETADSGAKIMVWSDDAYFGLDYEDDIEPESLFAKLANAHENILAIKIDGPTKEDYVWGLRTGFITFASKGMKEEHYDALIKKLMGAIRSSVSCAATPSQSLMLHMLGHPESEAEKTEFRKLLEERYRVVRKFIDAHKDHPVLSALPFNSGYFMSMKCTGVGAEELRVKLLHDHGIGTIAIDSSHLRVAFSSVDTEKLEMVFEVIFQTAIKIVETKNR
ncbi:MAG TPA: aminotransferase class I/II-fold pyridoxal phosphate-dependent enzyme [Treponemataceae bacterium]|nr:aminotransferase class I/II-fold pyridoxal phosphate-dependent enzyme [Treponemataceae bacterium]HOS36556.1 aminotransferase class I/II-fold pyridoxal phosphate-dependent enzyme [Treponemataceae bacterium]HPL90723.1 aminotransferase class I/II-fold pyridoxal phosphate-dependent enzyme [Treponemataceae bacterium]